MASVHDKLGRVRKPRVHISYEVETGGAVVQKELPFVAGVLGDFSGDPTTELKPLRDRKFVQIDRDNFDDMHMTCAQLTADMDDTGGLSVWMSDTAPQPEISTVTARGPLRIIRAGKEIIGAHLRYTADAQWAEVWAEEGRDVILTEAGRPAPVRAGRVLWDLANNRIEMRNARGGVSPAER